MESNAKIFIVYFASNGWNDARLLTRTAKNVINQVYGRTLSVRTGDTDTDQIFTRETIPNIGGNRLKKMIDIF